MHQTGWFLPDGPSRLDHTGWPASPDRAGESRHAPSCRCVPPGRSFPAFGNLYRALARWWVRLSTKQRKGPLAHQANRGSACLPSYRRVRLPTKRFKGPLAYQAIERSACQPSIEGSACLPSHREVRLPTKLYISAGWVICIILLHGYAAFRRTGVRLPTKQ